MKKAKIIIGVVIVVAVILFIVLNLDYLGHKEAITISFGLVKFPLPELANGVILLGCFLAGCLVSFVLGLAKRYKSYKKIKTLNALVETQKQKITEMAKNIESLKGPSSPQPSGGHEPEAGDEEPDDEEGDDAEPEKNEAEESPAEEQEKD